jgi:hypothetical protein
VREIPRINGSLGGICGGKFEGWEVAKIRWRRRELLVTKNSANPIKNQKQKPERQFWRELGKGLIVGLSRIKQSFPS